MKKLDVNTEIQRVRVESAKFANEAATFPHNCFYFTTLAKTMNIP